MSHLILIGFKHTGKTSLGKTLAEKLNRPFMDLDEAIELEHERTSGKHLSCRQILNQEGEETFRMVEHATLEKVLASPQEMVLAVGGGTPMMARNQTLIRAHHVVHVTAPKSIVFERIMINGKPAFFPKDDDTFDSFQKFWAERIPVFNSLAEVTIENKGSLDSLTQEIMTHLSA